LCSIFSLFQFYCWANHVNSMKGEMHRIHVIFLGGEQGNYDWIEWKTRQYSSIWKHKGEREPSPTGQGMI
jgi:hypothetical protein